MTNYKKSKHSKAHGALAKKFYRSKSWRITRDAYFNKMFGLCERCSGPGKIVHHIEFINMENINDPEVLLNHDNLELLCQSCHNTEHFKKESMREGYYFDAEGNLKYRK